MKSVIKEYTGGCCLESGAKLTAIIVIVIWICMVIGGCAYVKHGCGDYDKWNTKTKFRSK